MLELSGPREVLAIIIAVGVFFGGFVIFGHFLTSWEDSIGITFPGRLKDFFGRLLGQPIPVPDKRVLAPEFLEDRVGTAAVKVCRRLSPPQIAKLYVDDIPVVELAPGEAVTLYLEPGLRILSAKLCLESGNGKMGKSEIQVFERGKIASYDLVFHFYGYSREYHPVFNHIY